MEQSSVKRSGDATGDDIRTYTDAGGAKVQAVGLADETGNQSGVAENPLYIQGLALDVIKQSIDLLGKPDQPLHVQGAALSAIEAAIQTLGTPENPINVQGSALDAIHTAIDNLGKDAPVNIDSEDLGVLSDVLSLILRRIQYIQLDSSNRPRVILDNAPTVYSNPRIEISSSSELLQYKGIQYSALRFQSQVRNYIVD